MNEAKQKTLELFNYANARAINNDLWQLLILAVSNKEIEDIPPNQRGNMLTTCKKIIDYINDMEQIAINHYHSLEKQH